MKLIIFCCLCGALLTSCVGEVARFAPAQPWNEVAGRQLRGAVAELHTYEYVPAEGDTSTNPQMDLEQEEHLKFDRQGILLESTVNGPNVYLRQKISYGADYQILADTTFGEGGQLVQQWSIRYGANGKLEERQAFNHAGEMVNRHRYEYDQKGQVVAFWNTHLSRMDGEDRELMQFRDEYTYGAEGSYTLRNFADDELAKEAKYEDGHIVEGKHYDLENGELDRLNLYTYDAEGRLTVAQVLDPQGNQKSATEYAYNARGQEIERAWYAGGGELENLVIMRYDSMGNVLLEKDFSRPDLTPPAKLDPNGEPQFVARYAYEYDAQGNWTKQTRRVKDGGLHSRKIRKIVYFPE